MEEVAVMVLLATFVAQGEGVTSQATAYLPGDTVIEIAAHGEETMSLGQCQELAEMMRPTLPEPEGLAEGTKVLALDVACVAMP